LLGQQAQLPDRQRQAGASSDAVDARPQGRVFWTSTQLLTVSSQLRNPISTPARVLDVLLQAYATSAVAFLAGWFGAFFHRRGNELDPPTAST
jgi:hypothetical protein